MNKSISCLRTTIGLFGIITLCLVWGFEGSDEERLPLLQVNKDGRFLQDANNNAFFWLGDTGWLLFSKLDRENVVKYLDDRSQKGFNVIQVMVLHELKLTNVYGDSALIDGNISKPRITKGNSFNNPKEYDYWDHVDFVIHKAEERGIYLAMVPVWGSNVSDGKVNVAEARSYSAWLAKRYSNNNNIIWLNGGDTRGDENQEIWNTIGTQIRAYAPNHLITFHPFGRCKSSMWFHNAEWLDFNMFQSGHRRYDQDDTELGYGQDNWKYVRDDYNLEPAKPTLDGEPSYEGIPQGLHDPTEPFWNEDDVRRYAYWSVFAGACGFTYGHNAVMQMHRPGDTDPAYGVRQYWKEALNAPGAEQMIYLKQLMLSEPYFERIPDQTLIASDQGEKYNFIVATRGKDYAFIYSYTGRDMNIAMERLEGPDIRASWFNPRTGETILVGNYKNTGIRKFDPPGEIAPGKDWVLKLQSHQNGF